MRAMPIRIVTGHGGWLQLRASFKKNWIHYLQEALGLGIFMASACFFSAMLFSPKSHWYSAMPNLVIRNILMAIAMGSTALFIFYSPLTASSGSQINPAVSLSFLRVGKMCRYDVLFYIIFQILGGTVIVFIMQLLLGTTLTALPVNSAVTVPGKYGYAAAALTELLTAFVTMSTVLFTSYHEKLKKYTRLFAGCLVCTWVIVAGPISGFGMNPARSFASAFPAHTWTAFWIYVLMPLVGMLSATEVFLLIQKRKLVQQNFLVS
jgi:aquaporin Z